jgi:2-oxoglutarate dehydrogenase complex dehydrogenase (E1) component-like enzyme
MRDHLTEALRPGQRLVYSGRPNMAAPSGGDYHRHLVRHQQLVEGALGIASEMEPGS